MNQTIKLLLPNTKENITINLTKDGQEEEIIVLFIGKNTDQFYLNTTTHHQALHTQANTIVRGILFDSSFAQADGIIKIDPNAQYTNSFLDQKILLIGDHARANAQPKLEISANEVKASHAATVGKLDEEQIFYLMSRGINKPEAVTILVKGFIQPILGKIADKKLEKELRRIATI